jgi:hypothetical protein
MHSYHEKSGVMYFAEINKNAVSCWNTRKPLRPSNVKVIAKDDIKLIYPSDLSVSLLSRRGWEMSLTKYANFLEKSSAILHNTFLFIVLKKKLLPKNSWPCFYRLSHASLFLSH